MATDVQDFGAKIEGLLHAADREPKWAPAEADHFMAEWAPRRQKFDEVAGRLMAQVIRPRMETLAARFPQARLTKLGPNDRCACWFRYTERFPAILTSSARRPAAGNSPRTPSGTCRL